MVRKGASDEKVVAVGVAVGGRVVGGVVFDWFGGGVCPGCVRLSGANGLLAGSQGAVARERRRAARCLCRLRVVCVGGQLLRRRPVPQHVGELPGVVVERDMSQVKSICFKTIKESKTNNSNI